MANLCDLTPREIEILQLVLAGQTKKTIAGETFVSEKIVKFLPYLHKDWLMDALDSGYLGHTAKEQ